MPGSRSELFEKASAGGADVVFLDLEDAVAPDDKPQARKNVIEAINDIDWGSKTLSVRLNGLSTPTTCTATSSTSSNRPATGSTFS